MANHASCSYFEMSHTWSVISWGTKRHLRGGGKRGLVGRAPWLNDSQTHKSTLSSFWKKLQSHSHFLSLTHMLTHITKAQAVYSIPGKKSCCYRILLAYTTIILPRTETWHDLFLTCLLQHFQIYRLHMNNLKSVAKQVCPTTAAIGCWIF